MEQWSKRQVEQQHKAEFSKETKGLTGGAGRQHKHTEIEQRNTQPMACGTGALHRMALAIKRQHTT
jgi:hypothetical protein